MLIERNKPTGGSASDILNRTQDGHDNIIELCNFYKNGDTGLQMKNLAANNMVINCDSYLNCDEDEGDADGFAPKLSVGDNNYFYGCRAWANSDDGWDVFYKKEGGFGDNMTVIIENSISYKNGFLALDKVPENCDEYAEAYRLLKFLRYFEPLEPGALPPTSLLREFLGGSTFRY